MGDGGWGDMSLPTLLADVPTPTYTHTFWDGKKITCFNIYLRFTIIFTGLILITCSHSLPVFRYSEQVQYT